MATVPQLSFDFDAPPSAPVKICADCKEPKHLSAFGVCRQTSDGLNYYCKQCRSVHGKIAREKRNQRLRENPLTEEHYLAHRVGGGKVCARCKTFKVYAEFGKHSRNNDGLRHWCKRCCANAAMESYNADPETWKSRHRAWGKQKGAEWAREWRKNNPEKVRIAKKKAWPKHHAKHRDYYRALSRNYYYTNREECLAKMKISAKKWRQTPSGKISAFKTKQKRRALNRSVENTLTKQEWLLILELQENKCACCGGCFCENRKPACDHIVPLTKGGGLSFGNCQALCGSCNSRKMTKTIDYRTPEHVNYRP